MLTTLKKYLHPEYNKGLLKNFKTIDRVVVGIFVKDDLKTSIRFVEFEMMQTISSKMTVFNVITIMKIYASLNHPLNDKNINEKTADKILGRVFGNYSISNNP